jgi:hypothetical protein
MSATVFESIICSLTMHEIYLILVSIVQDV